MATRDSTTSEAGSAPRIPSGKAKRVISYRVAVAKIAKAILELQATGDLPLYLQADIKDISNGKA